MKAVTQQWEDKKVDHEAVLARVAKEARALAGGISPGDFVRISTGWLPDGVSINKAVVRRSVGGDWELVFVSDRRQMVTRVYSPWDVEKWRGDA